MTKRIKKIKKIAKKTIKNIRHTAKVVRAGYGAAKRLANPSNQAKMIGNALAGKGLVFPGSKYIGPGNEMNKGKPVDEADANAYQHDMDYDNYLKKGRSKKDVYLGYSDADKRLLKNTKATTPNGFVVKAGMHAKRLLNKTGLTARVRDADAANQ